MVGGGAEAVGTLVPATTAAARPRLCAKAEDLRETTGWRAIRRTFDGGGWEGTACTSGCEAVTAGTGADDDNTAAAAVLTAGFVRDESAGRLRAIGRRLDASSCACSSILMAMPFAPPLSSNTIFLRATFSSSRRPTSATLAKKVINTKGHEVDGKRSRAVHRQDTSKETPSPC